MPAIKDLTGQKFERLCVVQYVGQNENHYALWLCKCDCGKEKVVIGRLLVKGGTRSCGCLRQETVSQRMKKHGMAGNCKSGSDKLPPTPEYSAWKGIRARCLNPKTPNFNNYGGRGIKVCDRWANSLDNFLADMGQKPTPGHSIERIDNDGNYEPGNCRWATRQEQAENKTTSRFITFNGKTQCLSAWERELRFPRHTISHRLGKGWAEERALATPLRRRFSKKRDSPELVSF